MFRWSSAFRFSLRLHQAHSIKTELLLDHLKKCSNEYQVLQLIGMNRSRLTVDHVSCAMTILWNIQEAKPNKWATLSHVRDHPEFSALRALAHHNIDLMDDKDLVDILYALIRFQVEGHDPLVQQLVVEGWKRLECLDIDVLSKFAYCLKKQDMTSSPLMGQIANIADRCLDTTNDAIALSNFLASLSNVSSPDLQERLLKKTESVIGKLNACNFRHARRVMHLFPKYKYSCASLLEKCDQFFQQNINSFDRESLCSITAMYQSLHLSNTDFLVMAKEKLMGTVDQCNDAASFAKLYTTLGCMTSPEVRKREKVIKVAAVQIDNGKQPMMDDAGPFAIEKLTTKAKFISMHERCLWSLTISGLEGKLLTYADELQLAQLLTILKTMEDTECTNPILIHKIACLLQKHLHVCKPAQLKHITESLVQLQYQNAPFLKELGMHLKRNIISNYRPFEVAAMISSLSLLLDNRVDEAIIAKIDAIIPQCTLPSLEKLAVFLTRLQKVHVTKYEYATYWKLLKRMDHYGRKRIQKMENIDHLLNELRRIETMHWMTTELRVGILDSCQRLLDQVTWKNVTQLSAFVMQMNTVRSSFYEKITSVVMQDITKIHPTYIYLITRPFSMLNYEPSPEKEFFNLCIQYVLDHLDSFSPSFLTMVGFNFALSGYFPKDLIKAIFNTSFLSKLDASANILPPNHNMNTRLCLMKLNRAVCIEHPEYLIPWFHSTFCKQVQRREITSTHTEIHQLLGEILGGTNYTKMSASTPYSYSIDFEYILDSNKKPIEYVEDNSISANCLKEQELRHPLQENKPLPQGAQRFAVVLLSPRAIIKYSSHLKGPYVMMKRHLEILGYHVIQIPFYEWKQLTLESEGTKKTYLRKKIFPDDL